MIAVTDLGGHLKVFDRTDASPFLAVEVAINKAWTAVSFGIATHTWHQVLSGDAQVAQLAHIPRLVAVGGGYAVREGSRLIGGFGISGGTYLQDQQAAEIALKSVGFDLP